MTVSSPVSSVAYFGDGATTLFPVPFYFLEQTHLLVTRVNIDSTTQTLILGSDYSVAGAGNQAGGSITIFVAPANGIQILIERSVPATQETDYVANDPFPAESHERALDKLTMLVQQNSAGLSRALMKPIGKEYYDAKGLNISNVKDPVEHQDAATSLWVKNYLASLISTGQGPFNNAANVLYAAPGGVTRTVKDRLDEEVSIKDFGAIGDGVIDDTVAVQAAINSGLPLFVPEGTYKLTATLTKTTSGLYMRGAGPSSKFVHFGNYGSTLKIADPLGTSVITDITLMDMLFHHDTSVQATNGSQIEIDAVRNFWFRGVQIRNGFKGLSVIGSDQGHVDGLYVLFDHDNGGLTTGRVYVGVYPTANTGKAAHSGDVFFNGCNWRGGDIANCQTGFEMTAGDGIWIGDSHIGSCTGRAIFVNANNVTKCTGLLMNNCWIDFGAGSSGIVFNGSTPSINGNHYIRNCKVLGAGVGIHGVDINTSATRIRITDCEISDFLNHGVFNRAASTGDFTIQDCAIRDCSLAGVGAANGITYQGTGNGYIVGNFISGNNYAQQVSISGTKGVAVVKGNIVIGNFTLSARMSTLVGGTIDQSGNVGFNPTGNEAVVVGASPWTFTNTRGYPLQVSIGGGAVTAITLAGVGFFGLTSGVFIVSPGQNLEVTYTVAPGVRSWGL